MRSFRRCSTAVFVGGAPVLLAVVVAAVFAASQATAQSIAGAAAAAAPETALVDAVLMRAADGHVTVRATRIMRPLRVDGRLDEEIYDQLPPITDFLQQEPRSGAAITERTEAWVLFDDDNIYFACRCWDEHPERMVANDMRRDSTNQFRQDNFAVELDTFHDGRNGFLFFVTPAGGMYDSMTTDERSNPSWNGVWDAKAIRSDAGWFAEIAIPFKTLRYTADRTASWGFQMRRNLAGKNERAFIAQVSPAWGSSAIYHLSAEATLVGLETPAPALNLEVKPYGLSRLTTDLVTRPAVRNEVEPDAGLDVKYGVTKSLTADLTYNTDFAQVEADEAQVNLTRFNLVFPEKREFFLEGAGLFDFGSSAGGGSLGGDAPIVFYSRRVGLSGARAVPVIGGGRLQGRVGPWSVGGFNMETHADESAAAVRTNFSVARVRRDILRRSTIGGMFTRRSVSTVAPGGNTVWGLDTALAFHEDTYVTAYVAQSSTEGQQNEGRENDNLTYRGQFNYSADRYGFSADRLVVGQNFNPEIGFLPRQSFRRNFVQARFSPRTKTSKWVRKWTYLGNLEYITDNANHPETRNLTGQFSSEFHNSDIFLVEVQRSFEFLRTPFQVAPGARIPSGGYTFDNLRLSYTAGQQHRVSGASTFETGGFYNGDKQTATFRGRVELTHQFGVEPNISLNWIKLPQGRFTNTVTGARATYTVTPRAFVAALVQYSSSTTSLSTNLRFRWEYQPGSELFVVYTEGRSTLPPQGIPLESRGLVVKINRLFRF